MIVYLTNATLYSRAGCPQPAGHLLGAIARKGNQIPHKNALRRCDAKHHRRLEGKQPYSEILRFTNLIDYLQLLVTQESLPSGRLFCFCNKMFRHLHIDML